MSIKIITDSTSYIPKELIEKYDISICPLNVIFQGQSYDETTMDRTAFYEKIIVASDIPTSSQPSLEDFYKIFEKQVVANNSIVGIFLSSDMSGTYSSANLVKEMILDKYPDAKIEIVDSKTNSMQMGYAALAAARAAEEGKTIEEVLEAVEKIKARSRFLFVPNTLDYLKKGGRIGGASALIGAFLQIRPILTVEDGKTSVFTKVRTRKKAIDAMIEAFKNDINKKELGEVIVHHINSEADGKELAKRVEEIVNRKVEISDIGPVIGLHVGPGTVGIAYYTKNPLR
ncbi:DegV family protein [Clostridium manihotivorum]|uniref:Fatty acid-binding protein DegV n=1 Tax=Clostridium manihotivorum TaxID=2320868 RepID=A0A3R5TF47_9CLOT|nr:DegV family protein [Clostridium manihotivorum]QAA31855.1 fatty acid-binding protein DegV [Clostridium manihotivorum]